MISPHLPPEQAANALLPVLLGRELTTHDIDTTYIAHPPARSVQPATADRVVYAPRRGRKWSSRTGAGALVAGGRMALAARCTVSGSDLVHLHGNGFIIEVGEFLARYYRKPYVITLYGTDVWHHDRARHARFGRVVRNAACRVFYSRALLDFAKPLDLAPDPSTVIYAPVPPSFVPADPEERRALRRDLGIDDAPLLLTVKRLHPVGGHEDLLRAMPLVLRRYPDAQLWLAGEGELRKMLESLAHELGLGSQVRFLGLLDNEALRRYYAAADLFVLPSRLESWGTVMLEALACGTPVVATDTAGGLEVQHHFPRDVRLVAKHNPEALAESACEALATNRRTDEATKHRLQAEFSVSACAAAYLDVYREAVGSKVATATHAI